MIENEKSYQQKNEEQGFDKHFDVDFGTFQERIKQMENPFVYAGEPELMALVDVVQHPIYVHQIIHKNCFGENCEQTASPIHFKYSPEQKTTASTPKQAAHYDLLLDVLTKD